MTLPTTHNEAGSRPEAAPDLQTPPTSAAQLLQAAMQAHGASQADEATAHYEALLALEPDHPDGLHLFGVLHGQLGKLDRALALIGRAIEVKSDEAMFHNNMGNVLLGLDRFDEAAASYRRAVSLDPSRVDAVNNLAVLLGQRNDFKGAEAVFLSLLEVAPNFSDARQNLAELYLNNGRIAEAVQQCATGLVTEPRNRGIRHMLGMAYGALGRRKEAHALYGKWLEEEPDNQIAQHHFAAFSGGPMPAQAAADYVTATFDGFASSFESKLAQLEYRAPQLVADAVVARLGAPQGTLRVADAGCGTGLCAPYLLPYASSLVGVDLSGPMLEQAAARSAYNELVQADLTEFLEARPAAFDLLVSADTLCYFGRLEAFAAAARRSLGAGGLLVFTVEALLVPESTADASADTSEWLLLPHGRYSHRRDYVQRVLVQAGFEAPTMEAVVLRQENLKPVNGWLVHCIAP